MKLKNGKLTQQRRRVISYENLVRRYIGLVLGFFNPSNQAQYRKLANHMTSLLKNSGPVYTVAYLKECQRLINHYLAGTPTSCPQGDLRVSSRRGLPLIVPGPLRLLMEAGDYVHIRVILTILTFFRIIKCPGVLKLSSITDDFKGISDTLNPTEVAWVGAKKFAGKVPPRPKGMETLLILKSSGPNFKTAILGAPLDALAGKTIASQDLRNALRDLSDYFSSPLGDLLSKDMETVSGGSVQRELRLGKLSKKLEPAGKIRVFAMTDVGTQSVLYPLHTGIFNLLKTLSDVDGTFDQAGPLRSLQEKISKKTDKFVASYDLSAATDRLPINLQVQILSQLTGNRSIAEAWKTLLVGRDGGLGSEALRYSVGQPMGALSSGGMLALTHHFIIQVAASRVGKTTGFSEYAILGDDVVIADKAVAHCYLSLMTEGLGVEINFSKSIVSDIGTLEFAKRVVTPKGELTPLGANNIYNCLKNKANIVTLFHDFMGKGGTFTWANVDEKLKQLSHRTDLISIRSRDLMPLTGSIAAPFGPVNSSDLVPVRATKMLEVDSPDVVVEAFHAAFHAERRETDIRVVTKARLIAKEVLASLDDFGPKLSIGVTPDCHLESYSMLRSDYEKRLSDLELLATRHMFSDTAIDPSCYHGKPLEETLTKFIMEHLSEDSISPLDNPFERPRVIYPRLVDRFISIAKEAKRWIGPGRANLNIGANMEDEDEEDDDE